MRIRVPAVALAATALLLLPGLLRERSAGAQSDPSVLRAERIELVDGRGQVRAQLNVEPGGQVVFRLRDSAGAVRAKLGADEKGSGLLLLNERTEPGVHALATRTRTSVTVRRGAKRRVLRP